MVQDSGYQFLLDSRTASRWKRFGARRRAGVLFPLFSLHSSASAGVGEYPDIGRLAGWCRAAGLSIIQLLPLNDIGTDFRPYDAASSLALEPMHLSLEALAGAAADPGDVRRLRERFPLAGQKLFDPGVKAAKLDILRRLFDGSAGRGPDFERFKKSEAAWLDPYAEYKVLKARFGHSAWETWPEAYRNRDPHAIGRLREGWAADIEFEKWLQWQAAVQLEEAHRQAAARGVLLMGDLPFLVSRDSADVWAEPGAFKLDKAAGAPPDLYFADGQAWGMPPHDWAAQEKSSFSYLRRKIAYASRFYDAFRIDHFVGVFRVWAFDRAADGGIDKKSGAFDPADEKVWEGQGRRILDATLDASDLLPCAEDLGVVPKCSNAALRDYGIPGMEIQRWMRRWKKDKAWQAPSEYRPHSIAMISTHDMPPLELWWKTEAVTVEERRAFYRLLGKDFGGELTLEFVESCLRSCLDARSIFSIQLFQDWFSLERPGELEPGDRINFPGRVSPSHWRLLSRYSLEQMQSLGCIPTIRRLVSDTKRLT